MNERLEQRINEGLKSFEELEISEMQDKVKKGLPWHGFKTKGAFKRCGMKDLYEDYNKACTFVHIRDWPFPSGLLKSNDTREIEIAIQSEFNTILTWLAGHLEDFNQYCPDTLSDGIAEKIKELIINLNNFKNNLVKSAMEDEYAELSQIVILTDEE